MANFYVGPQLQSAPTFGASFGAGLGQGLSSGLQALADLKIQQLSQRSQAAKTIQGLQALGYSPQQAQSLGQLPSDLLKPIIQQDVKSRFTGGTAEGAWPHLVPGQSPEFYRALNTATPGVQQLFFKNYLDSLGQGVPTAEEISSTIQPGIGSPTLSQTLNELSSPQEIQQQAIQQMQPLEQTSYPKNLENILQGLGPIQGLPQVNMPEIQIPQSQAQQPTAPKIAKKTPAQQIAEAKFKQANVKEVRAALAPIREQEKIADQKIANLDRIIELSDKDIRSGAGQQALQRLGLGNFFLNPNSQEVQSISNELVLDLAQKMKGSLSDKDIRFLQASVPSLANTPEGMKRLAKMMKLGAQADKFYAEEFKKIIGKEKRLDVDTEDRAYEASRKKIDKMRDRILKEIESPKKSAALGQEFSKLPDTSKFPEGTEITDTATNTVLVLRNGKWQEK